MRLLFLLRKYLVFILCIIALILSFIIKPITIKYTEKHVIFTEKYNENNYYHGYWCNITDLRQKLNGYRQIPTFYCKDLIYDHKLNIIDNFKENKQELISINTINNPLIELTYNTFKKMKELKIIRMIFVNNRRANIYVKYKNKIVKIICNSGIPNINKLKLLQIKYNILDIMDVIDLRFDKFMLINYDNES